jgi:hypothetical protein
MVVPPLAGNLAREIGKFVAQIFFDSLLLLVWRCRLHDLHDSARNHGSTIAEGMDVANAWRIAGWLWRKKPLHSRCLLAVDGLFQRCQAAE